MRPVFVVRCGILAVVVSATACSGGSSPAAPSGGTTSVGGQATSIAIVGERGNQSFSPNPLVVGTNGTVVWQNTDGVTHRIVFNDDSFDSGDLTPGAASAALPTPAGGTNYHCSIHPTMIGAITGLSGEVPECTGPYC